MNQHLPWEGSLPLFYEMLMHMRVSIRVTMKNCDGDVVSVLTGWSSIQNDAGHDPDSHVNAASFGDSPQKDRRCQRDANRARPSEMGNTCAIPRTFLATSTSSSETSSFATVWSIIRARKFGVVLSMLLPIPLNE